MGYELFIARRLKLQNASHDSSAGSKSAPSLAVALIGVTLAVVVMVLSVTVLYGFKTEVSRKVYGLDAHIRIGNAGLGIDHNISTVSFSVINDAVSSDSVSSRNITNLSLTAEKSAVIKTDNDFKGVMYRTYDSNYNWDYIAESLIDGRIPSFKKGANDGEIIISQKLARALKLKVGDKVNTYFIDNAVRARKNTIVGIFNTNLDTFDDTYILGNIALIQGVNHWDEDTGSYVSVDLKNVDKIGTMSKQLYSTLAMHTYLTDSPILHSITPTTRSNMSFFSWLDLLDMNVVIILIIMIIVSGFTLISALLMIILERIKMVGLLKTLGGTDSSIRQIFIFLTQKLIFKALIFGNAIALSMSWIQLKFHIITLDPESYYMPYMPIEFNWAAIAALNLGIIVISYCSLIIPARITSSISPATTLRFQ